MKTKQKTLEIRRARQAKGLRNTYFGSLLEKEGDLYLASSKNWPSL